MKVESTERKLQFFSLCRQLLVKHILNIRKIFIQLQCNIIFFEIMVILNQANKLGVLKNAGGIILSTNVESPYIGKYDVATPGTILQFILCNIIRTLTTLTKDQVLERMTHVTSLNLYCLTTSSR